MIWLTTLAATGHPVQEREEFLASPHCLIGPAGQLTERLAELQGRWGFDYVSRYGGDAESFAPVVAAMARS